MAHTNAIEMSDTSKMCENSHIRRHHRKLVQTMPTATRGSAHVAPIPKSSGHAQVPTTEATTMIVLPQDDMKNVHFHFSTSSEAKADSASTTR